jgi:hypothetical protein
MSHEADRNLTFHASNGSIVSPVAVHAPVSWSISLGQQMQQFRAILLFVLVPAPISNPWGNPVR